MQITLILPVLPSNLKQIDVATVKINKLLLVFHLWGKTIVLAANYYLLEI